MSALCFYESVASNQILGKPDMYYKHYWFAWGQINYPSLGRHFSPHALQKKLKKQTQIRVSDKTWRESGRRWNERIARGFWRVHWWSWLTPATAQMWSSPLSKSNDRKDFFSKLNGFCRYLLFRPLKVALFFKWDLRDLKTIFKKHIHTFHSKHLSSTNATSSGFGT